MVNCLPRFSFRSAYLSSLGDTEYSGIDQLDPTRMYALMYDPTIPCKPRSFHDIYGDYISAVTGVYNVLETDGYLGADTTLGPVTINLPDISSLPITYNMRITIKDEGDNASVNNINIAAFVGNLIDGLNNISITNNKGALTIMVVNGSWKVISGYRE